MQPIDWDWSLFLIGLFTLVLIQFLQEYKEHKSFNFSRFKRYTLAFLIFNILYVVFGAIFSTIIGAILKPDSALAGIIYAGGWEGILGTLISKKEGRR